MLISIKSSGQTIVSMQKKNLHFSGRGKKGEVWYISTVETKLSTILPLFTTSESPFPLWFAQRRAALSTNSMYNGLG